MIYLVLANLYLCIFYAFYRVLLCKRTFFQWNRFYLLAGLLLAFTLPLLEYPEWNTYAGSYPEYLVGIQASEPVIVEAGAAVAVQPSPFSLRNVLTYGYIGGCILTFLLFLRSLTLTLLMLRRHPEGEAFSFFSAVRIDRTLTGHDQIRLHEEIHAREWHSVDIVLIQLAKIFNWFNPIVYAYERALRLQHEYIADGKSAAGNEMGYAELLVARAIGVEPQVLAHTFSSKRLLKNRIAMLLRDKSPRWGLLSYALLLPIICGMMVVSFACNQQLEQQQGNVVVYDEADTVTSAIQDDAKRFKAYLGGNIDYAAEAIRENKQGTIAFTYEKAGTGSIERVTFLNELWSGQQADILNVLQREQTGRLAPAGKYLVAIDFRISGQELSQEPPPPVPVSNGYTPLGTIVIIGYSPDSPPPPAVERAPAKQEAHTSGQRSMPELAPDLVEAEPNPTLAIAVPEEKPVEEATDVIFQSVEIQPEPPGGFRAFMEYIARNYDYPQEAIEAGVNGQVQIAFIIEKDGSLADIRVVRDLGYGTGEAAVRVLQSSSNWSPGIQNGRPVRVAYTLPIRFNLQT